MKLKIYVTILIFHIQVGVFDVCCLLNINGYFQKIFNKYILSLPNIKIKNISVSTISLIEYNECCIIHVKDVQWWFVAFVISENKWYINGRQLKDNIYTCSTFVVLHVVINIFCTYILFKYIF